MSTALAVPDGVLANRLTPVRREAPLGSCNVPLPARLCAFRTKSLSCAFLPETTIARRAYKPDHRTGHNGI